MNKFLANFKNWILDLKKDWKTRYALFAIQTLYYTIIFGIIFILIYEVLFYLSKNYFVDLLYVSLNESLTTLLETLKKIGYNEAEPITNEENLIKEVVKDNLNTGKVSQFDYVRWGIALTSLSIIIFLGYNWHVAWVQEWFIQDPDFIFSWEEIIKDLGDLVEVCSTNNPNVSGLIITVKSSVNSVVEGVTNITSVVSNKILLKEEIFNNSPYDEEWFKLVRKAVITKLEERYDLKALDENYANGLMLAIDLILEQVRKGHTMKQIFQMERETFIRSYIAFTIWNVIADYTIADSDSDSDSD